MERTPYFNDLPEYVTAAGRKIKINTDYRAGIRFELMLLGGEQDVFRLLSVWFKGRIRDPAAYFHAASVFFNLGREPETGGSCGQVRRVYDFSRDAGLIFASFLAEYGIDLSTARLHWWKFRALLLHLPADSEFKRVAALRAMDTERLPSEERQRIREMQRLYALTPTKTETMEMRDERWLRKVAHEYEKCGKGE